MAPGTLRSDLFLFAIRGFSGLAAAIVVAMLFYDARILFQFASNSMLWPGLLVGGFLALGACIALVAMVSSGFEGIESADAAHRAFLLAGAACFAAAFVQSFALPVLPRLGGLAFGLLLVAVLAMAMRAAHECSHLAHGAFESARWKRVE